MKQLNELYKSGDWKAEKHVPVIDCAEKVKAGDLIPVKVSVGKEQAHPNTTEHHIRWISVYFLADGENFPCQVGQFEFTAHGESTQGPNSGPVYTHHEVTCYIKISKPGTLFASSLCNIHGLWQSAKEIAIS
ncbi:MAG: class II SORL domain-containing protein [Dehalococcoidia bacterium]|nr:class II SORL domain-containing protein [Dehalococcoidia bacterium]